MCINISLWFNLPFLNGEEFSCALFVTCISSLVEYMFIIFSHFLTGLFVFPLLALRLLRVFSVVVFSRYVICKHFLQSIDCLFIFLTELFLEQKFLILIKSSMLVSPCMYRVLITRLRTLLILRSQRFSTLISSKSFMVLHFSLMFRIHFELIFI